jgi:protein-tyrosine-phosphatase
LKRLLFVCTGNTCRSPMAEGLFNKMLRDKGKDQKFTAISGGALAHEGQSASENAIIVMGKRGIDISSHRARQISEELLQADLILTMTNGHKQYILNQFPDARDRVFVLDDFVGGAGEDITDPFGGDVLAYETVAEEIKSKLERLLDRLENS